MRKNVELEFGLLSELTGIGMELTPTLVYIYILQYIHFAMYILS
jgi:hypothetical protein